MGFFQKLLRPPVLIAGAVVLLGTTLILLARLLGLSILLALLLLMIMALVVVIVVLVGQLRAARASEEIETTITRQAQRDVERSTPGQLKEMEDMKAELLAALESLKASKLARAGGKTALARLPWYLLIGPPLAGKSALVRHSGLHFALTDERRGPRAVRGMGGTRSFDWWLSEEAVLLDMPGRRLTTAAFEEDTEDWLAFLETLRKQRVHKPINGVIVAVGLDQLAERNEAEVDELARRIRARVQELVQRLGVVFPTYVVFTRCDRIAGFAEFFGDLDAQARMQPWGATVSVERARSGSAAAVLDQELGALLAGLSERRLRRVAEITDPEQRARAFAYPLQIEGLAGALGRFLHVLFEKDPLEETPLFRGFYFTSAEPSGSTLDRVLAPTATALGLPTPEPRSASSAPAGSFVPELFTRVVFPDAALAAASTHSEARRRRSQFALFAVLGTLFLAFTLLFSTLSCVNGRLIAETRHAARLVDQQVGPEAPLMANLLALESLRAPAAKVDSLRKKKPLWRRVGAYSGDALRDPALTLYVDKTLGALVDPALRDMDARLRQMTAAPQVRFLDYYFLFRAWRLLTDPRHLTPEDAQVVAEQVARALRSRIEGVSPDEQERYPELVRRQIAMLSSHPELTAQLAPRYWRPADPGLLLAAAARVRETWDSSQLYALVIAGARLFTKPLGFTELVGQPALLSGNYVVPGPWTLEGWTKQVKPRLEWYRRQIQRDWVVSEAFGGHPPDVGESMLQAYARDYSAQWVRFLNGLQATEPSDMRAAAALLGEAAQNNSQLFRVLEAVSDQTRLPADANSPLGAVPRDFAMTQEFFTSSGNVGLVERGRRGITQIFQRGKSPNLLDPSSSPKAKFQQLLRAANQKMEEAAQAGAGLSARKALLAESGDTPNPLRQLVAYAEDLRRDHADTAGAAPTARLLTLLVTGAHASAGGGMRQEISNQWNLRVVIPFRRSLEGKYPFSPGGPDASIDDFKEFFRPGGTLWEFHATELKDYVTEDGTPVSPELESVVSPALRECLRQAYAIREAFFSSGEEPSLRFMVRTRPPIIEGPHVIVRWTSLDVGGQNVTYAMGAPQWQPLTWPGPDPAAGASVRANTSGPPPPGRSAQGIWGLFRVLDQGHAGTSEEGNPQVTVRLQAGSSALQVTWEFQPSSSRHPFGPDGLHFALPPAL